MILPSIRPLGEFDEDGAAFLVPGEAMLDLAPPIAQIDSLLLLAPLVQALETAPPAHVAAKFAEELVVPASSADSIWLARDLAALVDEVETEGSAGRSSPELVAGDLAGWWQVTLDFLAIVTRNWPQILAERGNAPIRRRTATR